MSRLRVYSFTKRVPAPQGYVGTDEVHIQQLQARTPIGWMTLDEEEVPAHVKISSGALGDTGGWASKFAALGKFGRDGVIQQ